MSGVQKCVSNDSGLEASGLEVADGPPVGGAERRALEGLARLEEPVRRILLWPSP